MLPSLSTRRSPEQGPPLRSNEIFVADRIYIPARLLSRSRVVAAFERWLYDDRLCNRCDVYKDGDRHLEDVCGNCRAFKGHYPTWSTVQFNGQTYVTVPSGNFAYVEQALGISLKHIQDLRADTRARYPLTFKIPLYRGQVVNNSPTVNQQVVVQTFIKHMRGMLLARARSGKTVMAGRIGVYSRRRVLVIADERELLNQFYKMLVKFTNLREVEAHVGHPVAGIVRDARDLQASLQWDWVLTTYQRYIKEAQGQTYINRFLRGGFGVVILDEAHCGNAAAYARFLNKLDPMYKIALTATRERKDRLEFIMDQIFGPVVAQAEAIGLSPLVTVHKTPFKMKYEPRGMTAYGKITRSMSEDDARNALLVKAVFADLNAHPKNCIVIPVLYVEHASRLAHMINQYGQYRHDHYGEPWTHELAITYHAKSNKDAVMAAAREGTRTRVVIAIRQKVAKGVDVEPWNIMYCQFPLSNKPNFYQLSQRILTPSQDKPQARLRFFVDDVGLSLGCFANTFEHAKEMKYTITDQARAGAAHFAQLRETRDDKRSRRGRSKDVWSDIKAKKRSMSDGW